ATFIATAGTLPYDQTATLTASLNGNSTSASVSLVAPVRISSLFCSPTTLGPNASSTCTVTLTKAAPTGGANVNLSNNNPNLTIPTSVTVAAGATTATFNATTMAISSDQSATLVASFGGTSSSA